MDFSLTHCGVCFLFRQISLKLFAADDTIDFFDSFASIIVYKTVHRMNINYYNNYFLKTEVAKRAL